MKRIFALMLVAIVYFSSCNKDDKNTNLLTTEQMDTVTKGSYFKISFQDMQHPGDTAESFTITDLIVNNQSLFTLYGKTVVTPPDSLYTAHIMITDHKSQQISMNLFLFDSTKVLIGDYKVPNNLSTLTDYTRGENKTYTIQVGSIVHIAHDAADCVTGTFTLNLYYDHVVSPATGSFKIFH